MQSIRLNGVRYKVLTDIVDGYIEVRDKKKRPPEIYVDPRLKGRRIHMARAVHEAAHGAIPDLPERDIRKLEDGISRFLWGLGYRLEVKDERMEG